MKKGFTLIELLAVIVILSIVSVVSIPKIINVLDSAKKSYGLSEANLILKSIENYCEMEKNNIKNTNFCLNSDNLKNNINKIIDLNEISLNDIKIEIEDGKLDILQINIKGNVYGYNHNKMILGYIPPYKDKSGANIPDLLNNSLVPILYDEANKIWRYADITKKWYDYDEKKWANAVIVNTITKEKIKNGSIKPFDEIKVDDIDLWYVWIPRYSYKLFSNTPKESSIEIIFENGISSRNFRCFNVTKLDELKDDNGVSENCYKIKQNGVINMLEIENVFNEYYTHPAFKFGNNELDGIWISKFELCQSNNVVYVKPNLSSLTNKSVSEFFNIIKDFSNTKKIYGDSHMIKNMEWGAVAYLSQSKYGKNINDIEINYTSPILTGSGKYEEFVNQSTTKNIYGIYDLSGGAAEYVMGGIVNGNGKFNASYSGFLEEPKIEYYDKYSYNRYVNPTDLRGSKLGDATKETGAWYDDSVNFPDVGGSWFIRGGSFNEKKTSGIFHFMGGNGGSYSSISTRSCLVKKNGDN